MLVARSSASRRSCIGLLRPQRHGAAMLAAALVSATAFRAVCGGGPVPGVWGDACTPPFPDRQKNFHALIGCAAWRWSGPRINEIAISERHDASLSARRGKA